MKKLNKDVQFGFALDQSRCIGCRTCQMACKDCRDTDIGINFRKVYEYEGGEFNLSSDNVVLGNSVFAYYSSISCNHCTDPACLKACPTGATMKTRYGIVMIDDKACVGCKACAMACPYGSPQYNPKTKHMNKCDGCIDRIDEGKDPYCVESCPFRALECGDISELRDKYGSVCDTAPLVNANVTQPNLVIKPSRDSKNNGYKGGKMHLPQRYQEVEYDIV